nr:endospore germination permease [Tissierella creatinophila]
MSQSQAYILIITFIFGTSLALVSYSESEQDTWISMLISLAFAIPIVIVYGKILNNHPNKDIFQILEYLFGKIVGKIIGFLYTFYFFHLGAICIRNITEFIQLSSFPDTPQYVTTFFIGALAIYVLKSGMEVIARVNKFVFPLLIFIIAITLIMAIPKVDTNNLLPLLENGWLSILKASFSNFSFPFGETVIFLSILNSVKEKKKSSKIYLKGLFIGSLILLSVAIRNILILGFPILSSSTFPSYDAVTLIDIGNFIRGLEIIVSIVITIAGFIKVSICLLASCIGTARLFNFPDYKGVSAPLGLLMMSVSFILYSSTMHMIEWIKIYKYYAFPFQVILPIFILIVTKLKKQKTPSNN